jgi:deoxycytidine triphosphate deaminase
MYLNSHQIEPLIRGVKGKKAQVGIDLTVKEIRQISGGSLYKDSTKLGEYLTVTPSIDNNGKEGWMLISGHAYSVTFDQGVQLGSVHTAFIRHRSSLLRMGWTCTSGVYDPGFEVDEMGAVIMGNTNIFIEKGARIAQIIVSENYPADMYDG